MLLALAVAIVGIAAVSPGSALANATISGTVKQAALPHSPIPGIAVLLTTPDANNPQVLDQTLTNASGQYTLASEPTGSYFVFFLDPHGILITQSWNGESYLGTPDTVSVANTAITGIDAALSVGGGIAGTVTDAVTHQAVQNEEVLAYDNNGVLEAATCSDADGLYALGGLVSGQVKIQFRSSVTDCGFVSPYQGIFHGGGTTLATGTFVTVPLGSINQPIDQALTPFPGQIKGTVTDASTHAALAGATVTAYKPSGTPAGSTTTNASGQYTLSLPPGSYKVGFTAAGHGAQFYNGKASLATANAVSLSAGGTTTGINAALPRTVLLTVGLSGSGAGSVTSSPAGISCPSTCSASFVPGTAVTLHAAAHSGSAFHGWSGAGCSGTGACTVHVGNSPAAVVATLSKAAAPKCTLSASSSVLLKAPKKHKGKKPSVGTVSLKAKCNVSATGHLSGAFVVKGKKFKVGSRSMKLKSGSSTTVKLTLPGAVLKALKHHTSVSASFKLAVKTAGGSTTATTSTSLHGH